VPVVAIRGRRETSLAMNSTAIAGELQGIKKKSTHQFAWMHIPCESGLNRLKFAYSLGLYQLCPWSGLNWGPLAQHSPLGIENPAFFLLRFTISAVNSPLINHHHCVVVRPPRSQADGEA
jgi:hypothetical protein